MISEKLAIVGSGIAGLACAYFLDGRFEVSVFEKDGRPGGHSNTVEVEEGAQTIAVDTGFMVYNHVTYPNLTRFFKEIDAHGVPTSMSFGVQHVPSGLEYCGSSPNQLFAQRKNIFNPRFIRMLMQVNRFNWEAVEALQNPEYERMTLGEYVRTRNYGSDFENFFLIPMGSAVWSTPPEKMREFPAATLLRFFHNHGFLGMHTQHPWWTVQGASRAYVLKVISRLKNGVRLKRKVAQVRRGGSGVELTLSDGAKMNFDRVVLAAHADQSLELLKDATGRERALLGNFVYQPNRAVLHTDPSAMPKNKRAWASWNYRVEFDDGRAARSSTIYWMNSLQKFKSEKNYFVSINPERVAPDRVICEIPYEHPLFSQNAVRAQDELPALNREPGARTYFCGSYFKYGFHEDAFNSALDLAGVLLGRPPWA